MKKLLLVGALTLGAASCAPDIKQDPAPDVVVAQSDPSASPAVVPSPNDLAINPATGLVNAPIDPKSSAAQQEFTRDYLNTLNGFPTSVTATTKLVDLDKSTVSPTTVRFIDLLQGTPIATPAVTPTIAYDEDSDQLIIAPPATGWPKGGRYAVALIGGENGLKGVGGKRVVGSSVWSLATLEKSLVTCEDLTAPDCEAATDLIPVESTDPAEQLEERTASALQLEQLRRSYKPLLDALAAQGVNRQDIVLLWTFRIMNHPEVTFDPAASIIPFPNNILLADAGKPTQHLNLPIPPNASETQRQLFTGLNTLDGFSTTAPIVSENSETRGPIDTGSKLDQAGFEAAARFFKLTPGGTAPQVKACLIPSSDAACPTPTRDPQGNVPNNPQQIQFVPQLPLDEKSTYAAVLTTDLKDERGRFVAPASAFALLRLSSPLAVDGKSQVSVVPDAIANQLEPLRAGFKPMFDALAAQGLPRSKIALGWAFTTQSTVSIQKQLYALPASYGPAGLTAAPAYLADITTTFKNRMTASGLASDNIGKVFQGMISVPVLLTGTGGTLNPAAPKFERAPFLLALPATPVPANGYPVAIFSHGLKSTRNAATPLLNALAAGGHATIAIDTVFHGDRSTCAGITAASGITDGSAAIDTPDKACNTGGRCDVNTASATYGRCVAADPATRLTCDPSTGTGDLFCTANGQGRCLQRSSDPADGLCEGSSFRLNARGEPFISGWNLLNLGNLFATRDNFRQHTVEHSQLERVLTSTATGNINAQLEAQLAPKLDTTQIDYVAHSLGGIVGPLYVSASPKVRRAVFNVPAGNLTGILLTSTNKDFTAARNGFIGALEAQGIVRGTPAFDQFIGLAKTILDPADPINYIYAVENAQGLPAGREAFIQYIDADGVTPNPLTEALIAAANDRAAQDKKVTTYKFVPATPPAEGEERHGFLLDFANPVLTTQAQAQVRDFVTTGTITAP
ncbi:hypothetical protein [Hyalangium gracile]|uniref:hypothetical protein n=1 Tax=Hyalangium gracile TaxID=394092 RepID=UPI001CCC71DD|nr:hypothetical protein [Hyalangium gracile]